MTLRSDRVFHDFQYHPATNSTRPLHEQIRAACFDLAEFILHAVPEGREQGIALTKVEEVMFWANAGVARAVYDTEEALNG